MMTRNRDPLRLAANRLNRSAPQGERVAYVNPAEERLMKAFGGSGRPVNGIPSYQPVMPGYGEALGESAAAQLALVTGKPLSYQGKDYDFSEIIPRGLEDIVAAERPGRMAAAQQDTDVLRRTLLGDEQTADDQGRIITGYKDVPAGSVRDGEQYQWRRFGTGPAKDWNPPKENPETGEAWPEHGTPLDAGLPVSQGGRPFTKGEVETSRWGFELLDSKGNVVLQSELSGGGFDDHQFWSPDEAMSRPDADGKTDIDRFYDKATQRGYMTSEQVSDIRKSENPERFIIGGGGDMFEREPEYQKDPETGAEINDKWLASQGKPGRAGQTIREGGGLVDLYGPKGIAQYATAEDVSGVGRDRRITEIKNQLTSGALDPDSAAGERAYREIERLTNLKEGDFMGYKGQAGMASEADVRAGRAESVGDFMGLTAASQDAAEHMARRQREADLADVERLGGRATAAFRGQGDIAGALTQARELGPGGAAAPSAIPGAGMGAAGPAAEQVREMYLRTLGREPDPSGLAAWSSQLQAGSVTPQQIESAFVEARATGEEPDLQPIEGRLQAQAQRLGAERPEVTGEGYAELDAVGGPTMDVPTGYTPSAGIAGPSLSVEPGYEELDAVGAPDMSRGYTYTADTGISGGRIGQGGAFDPTSVAGQAPPAPGVSMPVQSAATPGEPQLMAPGTGPPSGTDPLRRQLMGEAGDALGAGLTERERRNIEQASRTASGARGRMRDYGSIVGEVTALTQEDRQRQAMNRAFAQQALGQEVGIQEADLQRSMQAQMANQAARNRQLEFGVGAGLQQEQAREQMAMQGRMADIGTEAERRQFGVQAALQQEQFGAQQNLQAQLANQAAKNEAMRYGVGAGLQQEQAREQMGMQGRLADLGAEQARRELGAQQGFAAELANLEAGERGRQLELASAESDITRQLAQRELAERQRQTGLQAERDYARQMVGLETSTVADPFQAITGRPIAGAIPGATEVARAANYGLVAGPQFVTPQTGLGYTSAKSAAEAGMWGAQQQADAARSAGKKSLLGNLIGGAATIGAAICWVAREAYGADNPKWLRFREWMLHRAPDDLREYYMEHGPAIAESIRHDEPAKARMRDTMDAVLEGA